MALECRSGSLGKEAVRDGNLVSGHKPDDDIPAFNSRAIGLVNRVGSQATPA